MNQLNNVIVTGTVLSAPKSFSDKGPAKFMVKVQDGEKRHNFINVEAWGDEKAKALNYLDKDTQVTIIGKWVTGSYEKNGQKVYTNALNVGYMTSNEKDAIDTLTQGLIKQLTPQKKGF